MTEEITDEASREIAYTAWLENLRADVSETFNGTLLRGARSVPIGTAENATHRPLTSPGAVVGFSVRETASAAATVRLRDGDAAGDLVATIALAADGSVSEWYGPGGINLSRGLYVEVVAGTVEGAVYLRGVD